MRSVRPVFYSAQCRVLAQNIMQQWCFDVGIFYHWGFLIKTFSQTFRPHVTLVVVNQIVPGKLFTVSSASSATHIHGAIVYPRRAWVQFHRIAFYILSRLFATANRQFISRGYRVNSINMRKHMSVLLCEHVFVVTRRQRWQN